MAIIKMCSNAYDQVADVMHLIKYMLNSQKIIHHISGSGGLYLYQNVELIAQQFENIACYYGKNSGSLVYHMIVSYPYLEGENDLQMVEQALQQVLRIELGGFPYIYVMHENTMKPHFHILIGSVNVYTGMKYKNKNTTLYEIAQTFSYYTYYINKNGKRCRVPYDVVFD